MGVNNKARRAARRRKRDARSGSPRAGTSTYDGSSEAGHDHYAVAALVQRLVEACAADPGAAVSYATSLTDADSGLAPSAVAEVVEHVVGTFLGVVTRSGWAPADLGQITRRRLTTRHVPALAAALATETGRHPSDRVSDAWREDLARLGPACPADLRTVDGLAQALGLAGLFSVLPALAVLIPPPGVRSHGAGRSGHAADARQLARVRALLAKAESTEFEEEADALSAKAQELISRYALDRLMDDAAAGPAQGQTALLARRLWIDAPYVFPKALLIDAVASANRCRSVVAEELGFATIVGEPRDLDAVELLATSLLVQGNACMLRHGRHGDGRGRSRTRPFRRSFLIAYATRIGERLRAATLVATEQAGRSGELVPVLERHEQRVAAATQEMFPRLLERGTSISDGYGWAAGRAAADLAMLDADLQVTSAAG